MTEKIKAALIWAEQDGKEYWAMVHTNSTEYIATTGDDQYSKVMQYLVGLAEPNYHIDIDHDEYDITVQYELDYEHLLYIADKHNLSIETIVEV
jgi:hypothetical protein